MKIKILYFASLREKLGAGAEEAEVPESVASVAELVAHLAGRGGAWAALRETPNLRMAVNQDMAEAGTPVKAGDEVAFFPPVTGG